MLHNFFSLLRKTPICNACVIHYVLKKFLLRVQVEPDEAVQDKIYFIINNLAPNNMDLKVGEMRELLRVDFLPWLANYLVLKRVSLEANFHQLYMSFLDKLAITELNVLVCAHT